MPNSFVHVELNTADVATAKKFYRGLFDWKLEDVRRPDMIYTMIDVGKGVGGGMMHTPMPDAPTQWLPYVLVDDAAKAIAKARKLGATIVVESKTVMGMGTLGIFVDPTGAMLAVWEAVRKAPAKRRAKSRKK